MSDKRTVATDALETLGTIIDETASRDAIHLAVEPVIAGELLHPGQKVFASKGIAIIATKYALGIVDPFLKQDVLPGQRFWLVVNPGQITSLRHVWTHPHFDDVNTEEIYCYDENNETISKSDYDELCESFADLTREVRNLKERLGESEKDIECRDMGCSV